MKPAESQPAWGTYAPSRYERAILSMCAQMPARPSLFYGITKGMRSLIRRDPPRLLDVAALGLRFRLTTRGNYCDTKLLFSAQFYDTHEMDWLCRELGDGGTFLDIGGNIGVYSLLVASRSGARVAVHTVEPFPEIAERLRVNIGLNGLPITIHRTALSDYEGVGQIVVSTRQSGENRFAADAPGSEIVVAVPVTTLHRLCTAAGIGEIRAMKIDIEGHEYRALKPFFHSAPAALWPQALVIETTHGRDGIVDFLTDHCGYRAVGSTKRNLLLKRPPTA